MGYYTRFRLDVKGTGPVLEQFNADVDSDKVTVYGSPLSWLVNGDADEWKWYEHDDDMDALSLQYPNLLFILEGEGEENGDQWKTWYKNGKHVTVHAQITFPEPDLSALPEVDDTPQRELAERREALRKQIADIQAELDGLEQPKV